MSLFDAIVIGGGPAGLSAAMTLGRMRRNVLVLDNGEPRNGTVAEMHNFLTRDGFPPVEVRRIGQDELRRYQTVEYRHAAAVSAEKTDDGNFNVALPGAVHVRSRRLVLATGLLDELPFIEGLAPLWGKFVFNCPYCDGYEVRDSALAVLGNTSDRALAALHLLQLTSDVTLCTNGPAELNEQTLRVLHERRVKVRDAQILRIDTTADRSVRLLFKNGEALQCRAVFVRTKIGQRSKLAAQLGCETFEDGCVRVDDFGRTSIDGVYAAGDMARREAFFGPTAAVIAASASGMIAAAFLDQALLRIDLGIA